MKRYQKRGLSLILAFCVFLGAGALALTLFPAPLFSSAEKRMLTAFPTYSSNALLTGSYTASLSTYAEERFPYRGTLRGVRAALELGLGKHEVRGIILCRDKSLTARPTPNSTAYAQNLSALNALKKRMAEADVPLTVAVAPRRIDVREEVLPLGYDTSEDRAVWNAVKGTDTVTFLDCREDACWFRTDHHWTVKGAYSAYCRLGTHLGYTPLAASSFSPETVNTRFFGTSHATAGIPGISPDMLEVWHHGQEEALLVTRDGITEFEGLYDMQKAKGYDPYSVFLGGNCFVTEISRGEGDTRPLLLVIKDSFANSLLPFLAVHYRILAVDPRYGSAPLSAFLERADAALLLCGMQTLSESVFLPSLLRRA